MRILPFTDASQKRIEHAAHNAAVCRHLHEATTYNDWIVTTAYYAVVHALIGCLYPLEENSRRFTTFDAHYEASRRSLSKHTFRLELCRKLLPQCARPARLLFDLSNRARYSSYHVSRPFADRAVLEMETVLKVARARLHDTF